MCRKEPELKVPTFVVPMHWSAGEALSFIAFLEEIVSAVWSAHGDAMCALHRSHFIEPPAPTDPEPLQSPESRENDDDIPF